MFPENEIMFDTNNNISMIIGARAHKLYFFFLKNNITDNEFIKNLLLVNQVTISYL